MENPAICLSFISYCLANDSNALFHQDEVKGNNEV